MEQKQHITECTASGHMATMRPFGQQATPKRGLSRVFLRTTSNGTRVWVQQIEFSRREHEIILGTFPELSLAEARKVAARNRQIVDTGGDPIARRRSEYVMLLREELDRLSSRIGRDTGRPSLEIKGFDRDAGTPPLKGSLKGVETAPAEDEVHVLQTPLFGLRIKVQKIIHLILQAKKEPVGQFAETEMPDTSMPEEAPIVPPQYIDSVTMHPHQDAQACAEQAPVVCNVDVMAGIRLKANEIGPNVAVLVRIISRNALDPNQGIAKCAELLSLESQCDAASLDAACAHALKLKTCSLSAVVSFLNGTHKAPSENATPESETISHGNIRGADYFH